MGRRQTRSSRCCGATASVADKPRTQEARDLARTLTGTPEFAKSRNERKKVEMRSAHLTTHHCFEPMRLRGLSGARYEIHLATIVQNLKTLAGYVWHPLSNV